MSKESDTPQKEMPKARTFAALYFAETKAINKRLTELRSLIMKSAENQT